LNNEQLFFPVFVQNRNVIYNLPTRQTYELPYEYFTFQQIGVPDFMANLPQCEDTFVVGNQNLKLQNWVERYQAWPTFRTRGEWNTGDYDTFQVNSVGISSDCLALYMVFWHGSSYFLRVDLVTLQETIFNVTENAPNVAPTIVSSTGDSMLFIINDSYRIWNYKTGVTPIIDIPGTSFSRNTGGNSYYDGKKLLVIDNTAGTLYVVDGF